ncbi:MAG: GntR family transcriptional regulator [Planctomycetota bacterium]
MFNVQISPGGGIPIFRQIVFGVRDAVARGKLAAGDPLPSVRAMATSLVVNPNTVSRAYSELVRDGLIESQPGRGYFVASRRDIFTLKEKKRRIFALIDPMLSEARVLGLSDEELSDFIAQRMRKLPSAAPASDGAANPKRAKSTTRESKSTPGEMPSSGRKSRSSGSSS